MDYKTYENDINYFVSNLVYYHLRSKPNCTVAWLAEKINKSISFVNKAISVSENKHFNVKHLFLIADALNLEPNQLFPSMENYKLLTGKEITKKDWKRIVDNYKKDKENMYD